MSPSSDDEKREDHANRSVLNIKEGTENVLSRVYSGLLEQAKMKLTELQFLKEKVFEIDRRLNELRNITPKA